MPQRGSACQGVKSRPSVIGTRWPACLGFNPAPTHGLPTLYPGDWDILRSLLTLSHPSLLSLSKSDWRGHRVTPPGSQIQCGARVCQNGATLPAGWSKLQPSPDEKHKWLSPSSNHLCLFSFFSFLHWLIDMWRNTVYSDSVACYLFQIAVRQLEARLFVPSISFPNIINNSWEENVVMWEKEPNYCPKINLLPWGTLAIRSGDCSTRCDTNLVFPDFHRAQILPLRWASGHLLGWTCWTWWLRWPQPSGCACAWARSAPDERAPRTLWACRAFPERRTRSGSRRWSRLWSGCTSVGWRRSGDGKQLVEAACVDVQVTLFIFNALENILIKAKMYLYNLCNSTFRTLTPLF